MIIDGAVIVGDGETGIAGTGGRVRWVLFGSAAAVALAVDLATKRIVQSTLELGETHGILGGFRLQYARNDGVAFGLLSGRQSLIIVAASLALLAIIAYVWLDRRPIAAAAGGLMAGGSLGNLAERVANGHVTDFLHLPYWATFNFADTFIVIGVALMALTLLLDLRGGRSPGS